eukprot:GHVN01065863.1.p1 GENE.GHVN01065863.1~~GHVN01065863.1.p1  ORF type:complete len:573 (+),score=113.85 GHVN01065863.1:741-2459(+)
MECDSDDDVVLPRRSKLPLTSSLCPISGLRSAQAAYSKSPHSLYTGVCLHIMTLAEAKLARFTQPDHTMVDASPSHKQPLAHPHQASPQKGFSVIIPHCNRLSLSEESTGIQNEVDEGLVGCATWNASLAMSDLLLQWACQEEEEHGVDGVVKRVSPVGQLHLRKFIEVSQLNQVGRQHSSVMELGCGLGVLGPIWARFGSSLGVSTVHLTDSNGTHVNTFSATGVSEMNVAGEPIEINEGSSTDEVTISVIAKCKMTQESNRMEDGYPGTCVVDIRHLEWSTAVARLDRIMGEMIKPRNRDDFIDRHVTHCSGEPHTSNEFDDDELCSFMLHDDLRLILACDVWYDFNGVDQFAHLIHLLISARYFINKIDETHQATTDKSVHVPPRVVVAHDERINLFCGGTTTVCGAVHEESGSNVREVVCDVFLEHFMDNYVRYRYDKATTMTWGKKRITERGTFDEANGMMGEVIDVRNVSESEGSDLKRFWEAPFFDAFRVSPALNRTWIERADKRNGMDDADAPSELSESVKVTDAKGVIGVVKGLVSVDGDGIRSRFADQQGVQLWELVPIFSG